MCLFSKKHVKTTKGENLKRIQQKQNLKKKELQEVMLRVGKQREKTK